MGNVSPPARRRSPGGHLICLCCLAVPSLPPVCVMHVNPRGLLSCVCPGMKHMFDGYAMLCKLRLSGGKVFGSQRYIQSQAYRCD